MGNSSNPAPRGEFTTTHWTAVLRAGREHSPSAQAALEKLCEAYWPPLYAFVRRQGHSPHDAQDLTQAFFARLLEKGYLALADPSRGKFRTFLLGSLKNFLTNDWRKGRVEKRGGGRNLVSLDAQAAETRYQIDVPDDASPDRVFERRWALTLLERVMTDLRREHEAEGRAELFDHLKPALVGEAGSLPYAAAAERLNMSEGAVKVAVHRMRKRYRQLFRAAVAETVGSPGEVDEEMKHIAAVLRR